MKTFDINKIQLEIQSPHVKVNDELNNLIIRHIEKLGKTYGRIIRFEMIIKPLHETENNNCEVEAKLFIPGDVLFSINKQRNLRLAIHELFNEINRQLKKHKEKITKEIHK